MSRGRRRCCDSKRGKARHASGCVPGQSRTLTPAEELARIRRPEDRRAYISGFMCAYDDLPDGAYFAILENELVVDAEELADGEASGE